MTPLQSPAMPSSAPPPESAPPPTPSSPTTGGAGWWLSRSKQAAVGAPRRSTWCAPSRTPKPGAPPRGCGPRPLGRTSTDGPPSSASPPSAHSRRRSSIPPSPPLTPSMGPRPRFTIWWRKSATPIPLPPADSPQHGGGSGLTRRNLCGLKKKTRMEPMCQLWVPFVLMIRAF